MPINVLEYLESTAKRLPTKPAVRDREGSIDFAPFVEHARLLAGRISTRMSARNQPIAVFLPKSRDCVAAYAAILYSGNCYAPLDMKSPAARLTKLLDKLAPALL